jgi:hypothetical protein
LPCAVLKFPSQYLGILKKMEDNSFGPRKIASQELWLVHDGIGYASSPGLFFLAKISMAVVLNFV